SLSQPALSAQLTRRHRDLPSFPTRRSSDLTRNRRQTPPSPQNLKMPSKRPRNHPRQKRRRPLLNPRPKKRLRQLLKTPRRKPLRSEEHTSELQSRENLVCRLLLEKKKQQWQ